MHIAPEAQLDINQKLAHVEHLVGQHPEIVGLQSYEYLRNNGADQKQSFIAGRTTTLDVAYPRLAPDGIRAVRIPLETALSTLAFGPQGPETEGLYDTVEYRHGELFMVSLAGMMNGAATEAERGEAASWFKMAGENLYGKPEEPMFNVLAHDLITPYITPQAHDTPEVSQLRQELGQLTGTIGETTYTPFEPSAELKARIKGFTQHRFDADVQHIDPEKTYDVPAMAEALDHSLELVGGKELGWEVVIVPNSASLSISSHQKQVQVGENRASLKGAVLQGKSIHEIGIHVKLAINRQKAGTATTRRFSLSEEEGLATTVENAYKGVFTVQGKHYYLIAGLAYGLDNHEPRNFSETDEVLWRAYALEKAGEQGISSEDMDKATSNAFDRSKRMFRGTDFKTRGVVDLRDLAYRIGQEQAWDVLKDIKTQEQFDALFDGDEPQATI